MSRNRIDTIRKQALWEAQDRKCFYCHQLLHWPDCEIDHILPQALARKPVECDRLLQSYGLRTDFDLAGPENQVACHPSCNKRKGAKCSNRVPVTTYLEYARAQLPRAQKIEQKYRREIERGDAQARITMMLEHRLVTPGELWEIGRGWYERTQRPLTDDTYVITFSLLVPELLASGELPDDVPRDYASLCDWLQWDLEGRLASTVDSPFLPVEDSRDGEVFGVRVVFVKPDLEQLPAELLDWWTVFHEGRVTDVYGQDAGRRFLKEVSQEKTRARRACSGAGPQS